jgi:hypothetical protein
MTLSVKNLIRMEVAERLPPCPGIAMDGTGLTTACFHWSWKGFRGPRRFYGHVDNRYDLFMQQLSRKTFPSASLPDGFNCPSSSSGKFDPGLVLRFRLRPCWPICLRRRGFTARSRFVLFCADGRSIEGLSQASQAGRFALQDGRFWMCFDLGLVGRPTLVTGRRGGSNLCREWADDCHQSAESYLLQEVGLCLKDCDYSVAWASSQSSTTSR